MTGRYWQYVDQLIIEQMVSAGLTEFTGLPSVVDSWRSLIPYSAGETVGIFINGNDFWRGRGDDERMLNTLPHVINAVIKGLKAIGVPEQNILVVEPTHPQLGERIFWQYYYDIIRGAYPNVQMIYGTSAGYASSPTRIRELGNRYFSNIFASVNHAILLPLLKAITPNWGITGAIKYMQGLIQNPLNNHGQLASTLTSNPDVIIYGYARSKIRLLLADGIFGNFTGQHFDGELGVYDIGVVTNDIPKPWLIFNNGAPNMLFFATDPVALDQILLNHVNAERAALDADPNKTLIQLPNPQIVAGEAAGLGSRFNMDYVELELAGPPPPPPPPQYPLTVESNPISGVPFTLRKL